jgi:GTP cyclohydrolase I
LTVDAKTLYQIVTEPPVDRRRLQELCRELLLVLGQDPDRPGLRDTPRRWADWWAEFIDYEPGRTGTVFEFEHVETDQMVMVGPMRVYSLCEHHLLPFWCEITVAYIATDRVLGLSKFARIAHQFAHQLQLQEQLTHQIADEIQRITGSEDVFVVGRGEHLCMSMRGIKTPAVMANSVVRGKFRELPALRAEALGLMAQ